MEVPKLNIHCLANFCILQWFTNFAMNVAIYGKGSQKTNNHLWTRAIWRKQRFSLRNCFVAFCWSTHRHRWQYRYLSIIDPCWLHTPKRADCFPYAWLHITVRLREVPYSYNYPWAVRITRWRLYCTSFSSKFLVIKPKWTAMGYLNRVISFMNAPFCHPMQHQLNCCQRD